MKREIKEALKKLKEYFDNDDNTVFALIFGSYASGRNRKDSDVDVAVYFKEPPEGFDILKLANKLSEIIDKDVDLIILNDAYALLRHQVFKNFINITTKDDKQYVKFREKTMGDYIDEYKYMTGMNVYDR